MTRSRVRRAVRLLRDEGLDVGRAALLLPVVSVQLRRLGYRRTMAWLDARRAAVDAASSQVASDAELTEATQCGNAVRLAAWPIPDATCLRRSLVQRQLLKRRNIPAVVRFGARPSGAGGPGELYFHAWVEVLGRVVSEPPETIAAFVPLDDADDPWYPS